jgi:hypothetical protein
MYAPRLVGCEVSCAGAAYAEPRRDRRDERRRDDEAFVGVAGSRGDWIASRDERDEWRRDILDTPEAERCGGVAGDEASLYGESCVD